MNFISLQTLVLYDLLNHRISRRWIGHEHDVMKVNYGRLINLVVSASRDRTIQLWNANSDSPVQKLLGHDLVVTAIDFNPGREIVELLRSTSSVVFIFFRKHGFGEW